MDAFIDMAVSFNNKYIALFTESGMVWIGSADLTVSCYLYVTVFSSPVRKYRKSYCSHPGVGVSVGIGVAQNAKVFG